VKPRNTLLLFLVVAVAGAALWWFEIRGAERREAAELESKRLFPGVTATGIDAIELPTTDGETARLVRREGRWHLERPVDFPADTLAVDAIASSLADLAADATFDEPEPLASYGLAEAGTVRFEIAGSVETLRVGNESSVGGTTYVIVGDGPQVSAVKTFRTTPLAKTVQQLRDVSVLDFDRETVTRVSVRWPSGRADAVRDEAGEGWQLTQPLQAAADTSVVDGLLSDLQFLRADGFVDDPPPDAELGFDAPEAYVELRAEGRSEPITLTIGAPRGEASRAVRGQRGVVYEVAEARLEDVPRSVFAYREKGLAEFPLVDAATFELTLSGGGEERVLVGENGDAGWVVSPEPMAPGTASRLVAELSRLDAAGIAAESVGEADARGLGLAPPATVVRVRDGGGEPLAELALGVIRPGQGVAVRRPGDDTIYWAAEDLAEHVPIGIEAWQSRFLAEASAPPSESPEPRP
jgi:hypothetical protein